MSWNYRVIQEKSEDGDEDIFAIHEVYYNSKGEIKAISEEPAIVATEDYASLVSTIAMMEAAAQKEVIVREDIVFAEDDD